MLPGFRWVSPGYIAACSVWSKALLLVIRASNPATASVLPLRTTRAPIDTQVRSIAQLSTLQGASELQELYVASNKVQEIAPCISQLTSLRTLELGSNRIREIQHLDTLSNLTDLWLGRNRITQLAGLQGLSCLRKISVQSNRLESMKGLEACTALEELYLRCGARQL